MICNLCKLLYNPLKREMLMRIYASYDGVNVGLLADDMKQHGLVLSGVSQYLKQLEGLGVISRKRSGRYVNYVPDNSSASRDVRLIVEELASRFRRKEHIAYDAIFSALMNPFRARVVAMLAQKGSLPALDICEATKHIPRHLKRDLQPAVDAGLISVDDSETSLAVYRFIPPTDPFVDMLVSFC